MSSAHRPTWDPAAGKAAISNSRSFSVRDMSAHTRLKFRQPGQGNQSDISRRDLKLELLAAESDSSSRKAKGLSGFNNDPMAKVLLIQAGSISSGNVVDSNEAVLEEAAAKRRKILEEVAVGGLDADDSEDEEVGKDVGGGSGKGKGKAIEVDEEDDEDEESSDDDDDEDETAELLRELEKIKRERAEEKERIEREKASTDQTSREEEIATGNPLLNLASALNFPASPAGSTISSSSTSSAFGIKRRWDDDVIFKNQARGTSETPKRQFVNDLLRTEYHKRFLKRNIA